MSYPLTTASTWLTSPVVSYGYDQAGSMTGVVDFEGNAINSTDNLDGFVSSTRFGSSGATLTNTLVNGFNSATNVSDAGTTLYSINYSYGPLGTITSTSASPSSGPPYVYKYNGLGQLTNIQIPPPYGDLNTVLRYDPSGNMTPLPNGAGASYNAASELISSTPPTGPSTTYNYNFVASHR